MATSVRLFREIPGPRNLPIFGNLLLYKFGVYSVDKYHDTLVKLHKRYGDVVRENIPGITIIHLFNPDDARKVYASEGKTPNINPIMDSMRTYRKSRNLNVGLGNLNGEEWYKLRKGIQQFVNPRITNVHLPTVNATVADLIDVIKKRKDKNDYVEHLNYLISKWVFEGASRIFFETSSGCFDGGQNEAAIQELLDANREVFYIGSRFKYSTQFYRYFSTPLWRRFTKAEDLIRDRMLALGNDAIARVKSLQEQGKIGDRFKFLLHLMQNPDLNLDEVFILCFSLFTDGLTTTSPFSLSCLYCLSTYPEAQEKLYQEVRGLVAPGEEITADKIEKMAYLRAFIKECFRLFPIGTEVSRILPVDLVLSNYQVPAGTMVDLNHMVHLKNEEIFPNAEEFRPERWLNEAKNINPFLMTPFSHGVRTCAGRRFAENDLHVLLCRILQNFQLEYNANDPPMELVYNILLKPDRVPRIAFRERKVEK